MPTLSLLQLLPLHVVRMAVGHVVGSTRLRFSGVDYDCKEPVELLVPLMSVCHSFRAEACLRYYEKYDLDLFGHPDYY
ncbi:hypothetical protein IWW47_001261 [Coemansia sp. RSA 2052]|nr:hypothetical protein IWW47_001261 [Coemansia sp. RSA 2052]